MNFFTISQINILGLNLFAVSGLLIGISSLVMTIYMLNKPWKKIYFLWAIFCISVMIWGFGAFLIATTNDRQTAYLYWRLTHIGVIFIPLLFTHFVYEFLGEKNRSLFIVLYSLAIIFLLGNFIDGIYIKDVRWVFNQFYYDSPGPLYIPWTIYFFGLVIFAHYKLYRAYKVSDSEIKKIHVKYFFVAFFISFLGGSTSFLPVYSIDFYPFLNTLAFMYAIIVGYAITRYRFFDIRVVLKKSFIYGAAILISITIFVVLFWWLSKLLPSSFVIIAAISLIIMFQQKYKEKLKSLIDRAFFFNELDLSKRVSEKVKMVSSTHDLETFVLEVVAGLQDAVKAEVREVYIAEREHHRFKSYYPKNSKNFIGFNDEFINLLHEQDDYIIIAEELAEQKDDEKSRDLLKWLRKQKAGMLIIISRGGDLTGIIFLGKKIGGAFELYDIQRIKKIIRAARENLPTVLYWHSTLENLKRHLHEEAYKQDE